MALLVTVSVLSVLAYLLVDRRWIYLILSGAAAGCAQLTKSSAIVLLPVIGLLFMQDWWTHRHHDTSRRLREGIAQFVAWLATVAIVYVMLWPGMWVAPGKMLYEVFGNAFSYATEGSRLSAAPGSPPIAFHPRLGDVALYVQSILWRTTPVVWLGAVLAIVALIRGRHTGRVVLLSVTLLGGLFIVLFGLASGRNSAHYVLTAYVALDILAAAGLVSVSELLVVPHWKRGSRVLSVIILGAAVAVQAASAAAFYPYYYTYYSPIMEAQQPGVQDPNFGYGEGLDLAAAYLRQMPAAADSTVMAFYGRGPFSYFYPGTTEPLKTVYADAENVPQLVQILKKSDYLVIYYALEKGRDSPPNVMRALRDIPPQKSIWLNGIEYVRIYSLATLSPDFYAQLQPQ